MEAHPTKLEALSIRYRLSQICHVTPQSQEDPWIGETL